MATNMFETKHGREGMTAERLREAKPELAKLAFAAGVTNDKGEVMTLQEIEDMIEADAVKLKEIEDDPDKIFKFNPFYKDREYDDKLFQQYFKHALVELDSRSLSLAAEFFNIAKIHFVNDAEIATACLASGRTRELYFNSNFLLDIVGIGQDLDPEDFLCSKGKNMRRWKHAGVNTLVVKRMASVMAHELLHSIFQHMKSYYNNMPNAGLKNAAMDVYINHFLRKMGFDMSWTEEYLKGKEEMMKWLCPVYSPTSSKDKEVLTKIANLEMFVSDIYKFLESKLPPEQRPNQGKGKRGSTSRQQGSGNGQGNGEGQEGDEGDGDPQGSGKQPSRDSGAFQDQNFMGSHGQQFDDRAKERQKEREAKEAGIGEGEGNDPTQGMDSGLGKILKQLGRQFSKFGEHFEESIFVEPKQDPMLLKALKASEVLGGLTPQIKQSMKQSIRGDIRFNSQRPDPATLSKAQKANMAQGKYDPYYRRFRGQDKTRAIIYLDVSGSIGYLINALYGIIMSASEIFDLEIVLFSTTLNPITIKELKQGTVHTTGGTDFDIWIEDLKEKSENPDKKKRYDSALIITDGFCDVKKENFDWLKATKVKMNYLIVDGGRLPTELKETANRAWELNVGG